MFKGKDSEYCDIWRIGVRATRREKKVEGKFIRERRIDEGMECHAESLSVWQRCMSDSIHN